jgi:hypothetical protein
MVDLTGLRDRMLEQQTSLPQEEQVEETFDPTGKSLIETLSADSNYRVIKDYMSDRYGMEESEYNKRKIVDAYINQMRRFNSGQSVVALSELTYLNTGDTDQKLALRRKKAADAYKLFDSLGGAFSEDRTFGEKADAVYDYARAAIVDPVNIVSLGVGKIFGFAASKAAVAGAKNLAFRVGRQAGYQTLKKTGSKKAAQQVQRETTQRAFKAALNKSKTKAIIDQADKKAIYGSLGFDMAAAGGLDLVQQQAEITSGFKEDLDFFQAGLSTATGAIGGGTQLGLIALKNKEQIPLASVEIQKSREIMKTLDDSIEALDDEAKKEILSSDNLKNALEGLKTRTADWAEKVKKGKQLVKKSDNPKTSIDYDTEFAHMFFIGSKDYNWDGLVNILAKEGYKQPRTMNFTDFMGEVIADLPEDSKKIVVDAYETLRGSSDQLEGFGLEEFINIDAAKTREAAQILNAKSLAKQKFQRLGLDYSDVNAEDAAKILSEPIEEETRRGILSPFKPLQSNLIRSLVTHPGTTALNAIGWKAATVNQSVSDMIRGALYGGNAVLKQLTGDSVNAVKYKNLAVQMMDLQRQKVKNMVDPYGTYESVMDYLAIRPDAQKELFRYINGGVEVKGILDEFEMNPAMKPEKGNYQKFNEFFETIYGVKAQDFLTKTQEFVYALDKQMRIKYGKSYMEFMDDPELVTYLAEPGSKRFKEFAEIEAAAVQDALRNTFSKKYGGQDGIIQGVANVIEEARNVPGIGALVPFGQFWNNSVAFMLDHSGISLLNKYTLKAGGKAAVERDPLDLFTKSAVGWSAVGISAYSQMDNLEEGLAWFEDRDETGSVRSYLYDYPRNVPMLVGRMGAHLIRDGAIPEDLIVAFGDNFGTRALTRELGDAYGLVSKGIFLASEAKDEDYLFAVKNVLVDMGSQYASGFTRRFEPINQIVAMSRGEDYTVVDRKQGSEFLNDSLRYVDQIYTVLSGKELAEEKEKALSAEDVPVNIGRIVGYRDVLPSTTIEKLYNDIGRSQWKTEIKSKSPEAVNTFNRYVRPRLEMLADGVVESGKWDGSDLQTKKEILDIILQRAKRDTLDILENSSDKDDKKLKLIFDVKNAGRKKDLNEVLGYFDVREKDMWKLDVQQLMIVEDMVKQMKKDRKNFAKELGIE